MTCIAVTSSLAARRAAAAGLLSSCASPAAIVPSDVSRSRLDSRELMLRMTGPITLITLRCTDRCLSASSMNGSRGMIETRQSTPATIVTGSSLSVIAAIAPIQVGAWLGVPGSVPPATRMNALVVPEKSSRGPGESAPCSRITSPSSTWRIGGVIAAHSSSCGVRQPVEQVEAPQLVDKGHQGHVIPPGTRGSARRPSSPRPLRSRRA